MTKPQREITPTITFIVPPRRETVRLNLSVSDDLYRKLKVMQYRHECTMAQVVEMLMTASLPEYFNQYPIEEAQEDEIFLLTEGEKPRRCKNPNCETPFSYCKQKEMAVVNGDLWCKKCSKGMIKCHSCKEVITDGKYEETENDQGITEFYHISCYDKLTK